jgi:hypothetical protein
MPLISTASGQTLASRKKSKDKGRLAGMKQFTGVIMTEIAAIHIVLTLQRLYTFNPSGSPSSTMAVV